MHAANEHRRSAPGRVLVRAGVVAVAATVIVTVTVIITVIMGAVGGTPGGGQHLVVAVAVATAITTSLLSSARTASPVMRVRTASTGASGHIEASTAYWCALAVPRRPQRPRAPGQG